MVTRLQRFDFGDLRDFREPLPAQAAVIEDVLEAEDIPPPPPAPTYSEEELAAAKEEGKKLGYAEGYTSGLAHAREQEDAKRNASNHTIQQLAHSMQELEASYERLLEQQNELLSSLVLKITRKVTGILLEGSASIAISALLRQCLPVIFSHPELTVELHPDAMQATMHHIESLLQEHSYEGKIQFRNNPDIGVHDVVLDWGKGQATRNTEEIWKEIEQLLRAATLPLKHLLAKNTING